MAAQRRRCQALLLQWWERSERAGTLRNLEQHAAILRLVRKHLLCQGQPVPMQTLLLAETISGQNFKLQKEDVGG